MIWLWSSGSGPKQGLRVTSHSRCGMASHSQSLSWDIRGALSPISRSSASRTYWPAMMDSIVHIVTCMRTIFVFGESSCSARSFGWTWSGDAMGSEDILKLHVTVVSQHDSMKTFSRLCVNLILTAVGVEWTSDAELDSITAGTSTPFPLYDRQDDVQLDISMTKGFSTCVRWLFTCEAALRGVVLLAGSSTMWRDMLSATTGQSCRYSSMLPYWAQ